MLSKGPYDFTLIWLPDDATAEAPGPSRFTALQEQPGLRQHSASS